MAAKKSKKSTAIGSDFAALLADVKGRIQAAQTRAVLSVNAKLVRLYWDIGGIIDGRQTREGWGAAVIPRLAVELKNELPELKGFSERNIKLTLAFYSEYQNPGEFVQPPVAHLKQPLINGRSRNALPVDSYTAGQMQFRRHRQTHRYLNLRNDESAAERTPIGPADCRGN